MSENETSLGDRKEKSPLTINEENLAEIMVKAYNAIQTLLNLTEHFSSAEKRQRAQDLLNELAGLMLKETLPVFYNAIKKSREANSGEETI